MGTVRFLLATLVVFHHIAGLRLVGHHAVIFFFVISGYLITLVMQRSYGYSVRGLARFWINRALRLYPAYFVMLAFTLLVLQIVPAEAARQFRAPMALPQTAADWLANLTMVYPDLFPNRVTPRLAPATWAITIELFYYLLISLGLSRARRATEAWLAVSLALLGGQLVLGLGYAWVYYALPAGSLPFAAGALLCHHRAALAAWARPRAGRLLAGAALALLLLFALRLKAPGFGYEGTGASLALAATTLPAAAALAALIARPGLLAPPALDRWLGDLSYPIYVGHWGVALAAGQLLGIPRPDFGPQGLLLFCATFPATLLLSLAVTRGIDPRIAALRARIRRPDAPALPSARQNAVALTRRRGQSLAGSVFQGAVESRQERETT